MGVFCHPVAPLALNIAQDACVQILGSPLTNYAQNIVKDDGEGIEAALLTISEDRTGPTSGSGGVSFLRYTAEWGVLRRIPQPY